MSDKQHERHRRRFEERRRRVHPDDEGDEQDEQEAGDETEDDARRRAREQDRRPDGPDPFSAADPKSDDREVWDLYGRGRRDRRDDDPRTYRERQERAERAKEAERESIWERHRSRIRERQEQIERGELGDRDDGDREGDHDPVWRRPRADDEHDDDDDFSLFGGERGGLFSPGGRFAHPGPYPTFVPAMLLTVSAFFGSMFLSRLLFGISPLLAYGLGPVLAIGGIAILAARSIPEPHAERLGLAPFSEKLVPALLCLVPAVLVVKEIDNYLRDWVPGSQGLAQQVAALPEGVSLFDVSTPFAATQAIIVAVGLAPVVQEWFFRGVLQQGLVGAYGRMRGVVLTAFLYSMAHVPIVGEDVDRVQPVISAFLVGCLYGLARLATGSVLAPMLLSASANALVLFGMATADSMVLPGFNSAGGHLPLSIGLPCALLVAIGVAGLKRALDERDAADAARPPRDPGSGASPS